MTLSAISARCGAVLLICLASRAASAQRRPAQEFTKQGIFVGNFSVVGAKATPSLEKNDLKLGRRVGDAVRDRLKALVNKREAGVIDGYDIRESLTRASFSPDSIYSLTEVQTQAEFFRADEIVLGTVRQTPAGYRLDANLVLWRDLRMRQPIAPVTNRNFDRAVDTLALRINHARMQLKFQRRCENALRDGSGVRAVQFAREGIALVSNGALVRTCLVWALSAMGAPAEQQLAEAEALLEIDPVAAHAIEVAAVALDTLKRRAEAAEMWLRLQATDSMNLELAERVLWSLAEHGNSRRAEPLVIKLSDRYPENLKLMRQKWRIANDNRSWSLAVKSGEQLLASDTMAATDSVFFQRLATAYRMNGQPFKSVETVARGVSLFPKDGKMYALYTQFMKEEADTVIPRGLALFPGSGELLALNAKDLKAKGKVAESLDASRRAVELDSTIAQGRLLIAQTEIELGHPDSALVTLHRAVESGEDRNGVAQMALSKGNTFFRAANGTKTRGDFQLAMRYLAFADSLKPTPQTKFLLGAAALSVAQTALTDAPKITVKEESCVISQLGADTIPIARASLEAGRDVSPEATQQFLDYLEQIRPYADKQIAAFCAPPAPPAVKSPTR